MVKETAYRVRTLFLFLLLLFSATLVFSYDLSDYESIDDLSNDIWKNITERQKEGDKNKPKIQLPSIHEIESSELFSEERLTQMNTREAWNEAHSIAGMQSAYLEYLSDYSEEFVFSTERLFVTRLYVLAWASNDLATNKKTTVVDADIPYLAEQIGNELVGITGYYVKILGFLNNDERMRLAVLISETTVNYRKYFNDIVIMSQQYLVPSILKEESNIEIIKVLEELVEYLNE